MQFAPSIIPLQAINDALTKESGVHLFILRTDLNHLTISGNKLFKLKYNLREAKKNDKKTIITFGGAFSNHIAATAAAGKEYGFKTIGIIRGEAYPQLNATLQFATDCGMQLHYVSRTLYQNKKELYEYVNQQFSAESFYLIPEGGSNELGVMGCKEITQHINIDFDYVCAPCGTGATVAGIIQSLKNNQQAIGFQVLKAEGYIKNEVRQWLNKSDQSDWTINEQYHFGGYAKVKPELIEFVKQFEQANDIPLDYIYTSKMMFGIYDLIKTGFFKRGQTVIAVHTGGLQGNSGFKFLQ
jgi:1-aminocyclopropane-1-carboxylate deaminase